jgi:pre-60S factor REI1
MSGFTPMSCTTAPGTTFTTRSELAAHYKSPWHRYNLKRKEANLPCLDLATFEARVAAAQAMKAEKEEKEKRGGMGHLKGNQFVRKNESVKKKEEKEKAVEAKAAAAAATTADSGVVPESPAEVDVEDDFEVFIDPKQDIFSLNPAHKSETLELNITNMADKYGFFLPMQDCCHDVYGLVGYLSEKVKLGHYCLFCNRVFTTASGAIKHMIDVGHTKVSWEGHYDDEYDAFFVYDEFAKAEGEADGDEEEGDDDEDWEDVGSDEEDDDASYYDEYEDSLHASGFSVTPLGELRLPSGKILGHRGLKRYYDQHFRADTGGMDASAHAAQMNNLAEKQGYSGWEGMEGQMSVTDKVRGLKGLGRVGVALSSGNEKMPTGKMGGGVLVKTAGGGVTQLSQYRYKAMAKKARIQEAGGYRRWLKFNYANNNKMDKKGNRLMTANKHSRGVRVGGFGGV